MSYVKVRLQITPRQESIALKGKQISIPKDSVGKGYDIYLHPANAMKVKRAEGKTGVRLTLSPGEIVHTAEAHGLLPSEVELTGAGILDSLWSGIKSVGSWLKSSGVGSALADAGQQALAPVLGDSGAQVARNIVRGVTGVGARQQKKKGRITPALRASGLYI